ncbi:DUF2634 domain-containing protein [Paenibacillus qinlingensis]|uniref:DUF2634 domain-containing protein n=1 Tax=Paenibacillus qinlingensis TaxID=1837343 RepID=UPI00156573B9|nr:DUF2634 domain-containing protein [Paenibacillus qinlingensis]NQX60443.1 DUF2634 domain-containing protein [Paenibacillus qinlingensis]
MPNLFPLVGAISGTGVGVGTRTEAFLAAGKKGAIPFGRSPKFDHSAGEFVTTPTGKIAECVSTDAWLEWCQKALRSRRYTHLVYSRAYGQEYDDLIARHLSRQANEMEILRITTETLKVDPRTADVRHFTFEWEKDRCSFQCEIVNVRGEQKNLKGSVVIS